MIKRAIHSSENTSKTYEIEDLLNDLKKESEGDKFTDPIK